MKTTVNLIAALPMAPAETPGPSPSCVDNSDVCHFIFNQTKVVWLAESGYWLLVKPLRIALIIVLALITRWVISRTVNRLIDHTAARRVGMLRPLQDKMPNALRPATAPSQGAPNERRRQRAEALGSVLNSIVSTTLFAVAVMLLLAELGVNLGPILASAGVVGLAIGFGAQNLVKDFLAGLFMLLEDQYGVGDVVDVGGATGTVEAVGLRITTIRDSAGVLWYIRNGEILRVGNKSQGWAVVTVDVPVGFAAVERATEVLRIAAARLVEDPDFADDLIAAPEVLGVEQITADGAILRTTVRTNSDAQWRIARELRNRLIDALQEAGVTAQLSAGRVFVHQMTGPGAAHDVPGSGGEGGGAIPSARHRGTSDETQRNGLERE
jgi:small-conductance mechanosensitive channel